MDSDAEVTEIDYTAFTSRRTAEHVTARLIVRRVKRLQPTTKVSERGAVRHLPLPVESAWGAVPMLPPVRFPRPLAEPAVRISPQRALHGLCHQGWLGRCQGLGIVLPRYR